MPVQEMIRNSAGLESFLVGTGQQQASPADPLPQPLRDRGISAYVAGDFVGAEPPPVNFFSRFERATSCFSVYTLDPSHFNTFMLNAILFNAGTVGGFEAEFDSRERHLS